jgi:hypothetical protein
MMCTRISPSSPPKSLSGHHLEHRDEDRLVRDEHAEQDDREDDVRPGEAPLGEHETVGGAQEREIRAGRHGQAELLIIPV